MIERGIDWDRLNTMLSIQRFAANRFNRLLEALGRAKGGIDTITDAMNALAQDVVLPPAPDLPEPDGERSETAKPLVDSAWRYLLMVEALRDRKNYEGEDE